MVFFNCNACGESIKKNQVEKHYQFKCRNCSVLSCVDCGKDFWGDEYKNHNKCMTEDEKYGGKDYKAKPGANKGERKQEEWTMQVQEAIRKCSNPKIKGLLQKLEDYPNIPRKKAKFENFLKNSVRVPAHFVSQMWDCISAELNKPTPTSSQNGKSTEQGDQSADSNTETNTEEKEQRKKLSKRERKEERKKLKHKAEKKDSRNGENEEENVPKKMKKRKREEEEEETYTDVVVKKKKKTSKNKDEEEEPVAKKRKDDDDESTEEANESIVEDVPKVKFNWENVITAVLKKQDDHELSIKKLRKKVLAEYSTCSSKAYDEDKLLSKFNKKITKNPKFKVLKEKVKLIS